MTEPQNAASRRVPWYRQGPVYPSSFARLGVDDAAWVLWNLCSAHGQAVDLIRALEAIREDAAANTVAAIVEDVRRA